MGRDVRKPDIVACEGVEHFVIRFLQSMVSKLASNIT